MGKDEKSAIIARLVTSIIFGISFVFSKKALEFTTPVDLLSFRFLIAAVALFIMKKLKILQINIDFKSFNRIKPLLFLSIFQPITGYFFEINGINHLPAAESGIILSIIPIFVTIISSLYIKEKPNKKQTGFIFISLIGIIFVLILKDISLNTAEYLGGLFLIISAFSASIYTVLVRKLSGEFRYEEITYVMFIVGAYFFNGIHIIKCIISGSFATYQVFFSTPSIWIPALYLGLCTSVIGYLLTNFSLAKLTAFRVAVFNNLATVISIIIGVYIANNTFSTIQIAGVIMIISGVWGTNYFSGNDKPAELNRQIRA
jgi:drug/metabolite transporter (DMT)-like permease